MAAAAALSAWNGTWRMTGRKDYDKILRFNGVPEEKIEEATKAEDIWQYSFHADGSAFHMDHQIPATKFRLNFVAPIDGEWNDDCPYQKTGTTASRWKDGGTEENRPATLGGWRNTWDPPPGAEADARTRFRTELRNKDGTVLRFWRHLVGDDLKKCDCVIYIVKDSSKGEEEANVVAGPCWCYFEHRSDELPCATEEVEQANDARHAEM